MADFHFVDQKKYTGIVINRTAPIFSQRMIGLVSKLEEMMMEGGWLSSHEEIWLRHDDIEPGQEPHLLFDRVNKIVCWHIGTAQGAGLDLYQSADGRLWVKDYDGCWLDDYLPAPT